jgi:hypothetical protein
MYSKELVASIFRAEEFNLEQGGSIFLQNVGYYI